MDIGNRDQLWLTHRPHSRQSKSALFTLLSLLIAGLPSCTTVLTNQYEATALTQYTWQVEYGVDPTNARGQRFEAFASTSLLNRNGEKPIGAVTGPDDRGLWWAALPPRPTVDEIEQRQKPLEKPGPPQLIKRVDYQIKFPQNQQTVTLPTNHDVYREVVKAQRSRVPLQLTLGIGDRSVEKAQPR